MKRVGEISKELRRADLSTPKRWVHHTATQARARAGQAFDVVAAVRQGWEQIRHGPRRTEPLEKAALETLSMAGFLGGVVFGMQLPQMDLKLSAKGEERDALILHAAALMTTEIAAEWLQEVLRRTLLAPSLGSGEAKFLRAISTVLQASVRGVERGWSARQVAALWIRFWASPVVKQHRIATDAQAVHLAQALIEKLRR